MKTLPVTFIAILTTGFAIEYPNQKVNRVDAVHFGQPQAAVERLLEKKAVTEESAINRAGTDYWIDDRDFKIDFDSGKLVEITFNAAFKYSEPIAMYPAAWCNFDPIGGKRMKKGMMRSDFLDYLMAWEARAKQSGARRNDSNELMREGEYSISFSQEQFWDMVSIHFGPERSTGKGGVWESGYTVNFATSADGALSGLKVGSLNSLSVLCDEFNTHARNAKEANLSPETAPSAVH